MTVVITINSVTWNPVTTFVNSVGTDKVYKIIPLSNNMFSVRFGDGTYGAIPGAFAIYCAYAYGGGANSNVSSLNTITVYSGADTNIVGCTNSTAFTGGGDEEAIATAKRLAPMLLKTRDRFVTESDGTTLIEAYGGVSYAEVIKNYYGLLSAKVIGIATGGGNPSAPLRSSIQAYLISRTVLSSINVQFTTCTITAQNVVATVKVLPGYTWAAIKPNVDFAFKLFLSETGYEILDVYLSTGIADATTRMNSIFSTSWTSSDYTQLRKLLDNLTPRTFGESIQESDMLGFIDSNVYGVDYLLISTPASFPVTHAADEISTYGSIATTEIP